MKNIVIGLAGSALALSLGLAPFTAPSRQPVTIEGKDRPILLKRMVVTATPLPG